MHTQVEEEHMQDTEAFLKNAQWGDKSETLSGSGSTMANTVNVRAALPRLTNEYLINSMFDAPCGDGNWMSKTELGISYVGGDFVDSFVSAAVSKGLNAYHFDIRYDPLPPVDLWFCRACWYHLPLAHIQLCVDNFLKSSIKYLLTTSHTENGEMRDIDSGQFRRLQLDQHNYFGLGEPIDRFVDVVHGPKYGNMTEEMLLFVNPNVK